MAPRWPFNEDSRELLYVAPDDPPTSARTYIFPSGWDPDTRDETPTSGSIELLKSAIERQINARDHSLVEQSEKVACFRPFYEGNASRGVQEELLHFGRLVKLGLREVGACSVVLLPEEDRTAYPRRMLYESLIPTWRQQQLLQGSDENVERFRKRIQEGDGAATLVATGDVDALRAMLRTYELSIRADDGALLPAGALGTTGPTRRQAAETEFAQQIQYAGKLYLDILEAEGIVRLVRSEQTFYRELAAQGGPAE